MKKQLSTVDYAAEQDKKDPLARFTNEFYIQKGQTYLDGNSLGLLCKRSEQTVINLLEDWKQYAIDGWTDTQNPWFTLSEAVGAKMAKLIGANKNEVIATGSTTINLHQLLATFYEPTDKKPFILSETLNFPTDIYAMQSHLKIHGLDSEKHLKLIKSEDGHTLSEDAIIEAMTDDINIIILSSVLYRSGQLLNIRKLTTAAHERGILIGFDLCHSIGSVPHQLSDEGVDFAFWCTYKHLNGGPGSVAGLYVNQRHHGKTPGLLGWFGSDKQVQFDMDTTFTKASGAGAYQLGTPHLLSLSPLIGSLELIEEAGIERMREKSLKLTQYLRDLLESLPETNDLVIRTPKNDVNRGGHILIEHPEAARICKALKAEGIIPDFRSPNGIRIAPVALYNSYSDVLHCVLTLATILKNRTYKNFENIRGVIA
ncbi:kynureninase [Bacillus sp. JCM 19041]|uniref:kynureninase n=1 Tax=Bacillus sp. JCM 19041 TaxID=1460637 RepID=UPI0006CFE50C